MGETDFWNNQEKAQATVAELKGLNSVLKSLEEALEVGEEGGAVDHGEVEKCG